MDTVKGIRSVLLGLLLMMGAPSAAPPESGHEPTPGMNLSPGLQELVRSEMRELAQGAQAIAAALPVGDWESIAATSQKMQDSYILAKKVTPAQAKELATLPPHFAELDAAFHARTEKLRDAAERRDAESAAFHYSRLLEACVLCHASFAQARFPKLVVPRSEPPHH